MTKWSFHDPKLHDRVVAARIITSMIPSIYKVNTFFLIASILLL
jgi:hypothetical protein